MGSLGDEASKVVALLRDAGVVLDRGLSADEILGVERQFGFIFTPDHAELLRLALPVDGPPQPKGAITLAARHEWPDWRHKTSALADRLAWPIDGVLFDVTCNGFWPASWGARPEDNDAAEREARAHLLTWPKLVPIYSHRYLPAAPAAAGSPVFSVYQSDVIYYGANLTDYFIAEFGARDAEQASRPVRHILSPWSDLATGADADDL